MRIVFVRHGKPDYATDSLLDLGKKQAQTVANRLLRENVSEIYSSTMGRALETAEPFSKLSGLQINGLDFAREIEWGSDSDKELLEGGNPWFILPRFVREGKSVVIDNLTTDPDFSENTRLIDSQSRVISGFDDWLAELGYARDGFYYRALRADECKTVVLFCHGGSSTVMISHLLNLPFLQLCATYRPYFTSVSIIKMSAAEGELAIPKIELLSDDAHVVKDNSDAKIMR